MSYHIAILKHVYQPDLQGDRQPQWRTDHHDDLISYDSPEEARAEIADAESEIYVTGNNESERPEYIIVDDVTADYIRDGRNMDLSNYDWDNCSCKRNNGECCGECNECITLMIDQDRDYIRARAI